jgi:hypothetical protein
MKRCGETGPTVHRRLWTLAERYVDDLRELDDTGCSGHMSYVLLLLNNARFLKSYLEGGFAADQAWELIRDYGLIVNRYATKSKPFRQKLI